MSEARRVIEEPIPVPNCVRTFEIMNEDDEHDEESDEEWDSGNEEQQVIAQTREPESSPLTTERRSLLQRDNLYSSLRSVHSMYHNRRTSSRRNGNGRDTSQIGIEWHYYFGSDMS